MTRLDDPAYDVSYWNLHERPLALTARLLRLLRWASAPTGRGGCQRTRSRTLVLDDPALSEARRAARTRAARGRLDRRGRGGRGRARAARRARVERAPPAAPRPGARGRRGLRRHLLADRSARVRGLAGRARRARRGGRHRPVRARPLEGAPRPARHVRRLEDEDGARYVAWLWEHGRAELGLDEDLLPPPPAGAGEGRCRRCWSPATCAATSAWARRRAATRPRCRPPACRSRTSTIAPEAPGGHGACSPHGRGVRRARPSPTGASRRSTCCASTPPQVPSSPSRSARRRCARATRSASGHGRPTRCRRGGTARSTSSTRSGSTRTMSPRTSRAPPTSMCPSSSCRCP